MYLPLEIIELILSYTDLATIQKIYTEDLYNIYMEMLSNYTFGSLIPNIFRKDTGEVVSRTDIKHKVKNIFENKLITCLLTLSGQLIINDIVYPGIYIFLTENRVVDANGDLFDIVSYYAPGKFREIDPTLEKIINVGVDIKEVVSTERLILIVRNNGSVWFYNYPKIVELNNKIKIKDISRTLSIIWLLSTDNKLYYLDLNKPILTLFNVSNIISIKEHYDELICLDDHNQVITIKELKSKVLIPSSYNIVAISDIISSSIKGIDMNGSLVTADILGSDITVTPTLFQYPNFSYF